jgi:hypothetical protein
MPAIHAGMTEAADPVEHWRWLGGKSLHFSSSAGERKILNHFVVIS